MSQAKTVSIQSDVGVIVLYDPILLRDRVKAASSWWRSGPLKISERNDGRVAVWPIGEGRAATRVYRARLGTELSESERPYDRGHSEPVTLRVESDEIFLGPVERLPGDGSGDRLPTLPDGGDVYPAEAGTYTVTVHVLDWRPEDSFWNEDNEPTAEAPVDFVILLAPSSETHEAVPTPQALLDYLPKKKAKASKTVTHHTRPAHKSEEQRKAEKKSAKKRTTKKTTERGIRQPIQVKALAPGQLGVGATVRHSQYGVGKVQFMRDGFPKVKVKFSDREAKVDKSELTVVS